MNFLWRRSTGLDPGGAIPWAGRRIVRNQIAYEGPIVIDARPKPGFPKELVARDDTAALGDVAMEGVFSGWRRGNGGDSDRAHLD